MRGGLLELMLLVLRDGEKKKQTNRQIEKKMRQVRGSGGGGNGYFM